MSRIVLGHAVGHLFHTENKGVTATKNRRCARDFIIFLFPVPNSGPRSLWPTVRLLDISSQKVKGRNRRTGILPFGGAFLIATKRALDRLPATT
jgi:hypothetical protein